MAGPGEVRVRLEASGVNPADVGRRGGGYRDGIPAREAQQRRREVIKSTKIKGNVECTGPSARSK
jgi:NADPH:quinone reductase-like Zn-dependent oxidoreductase